MHGGEKIFCLFNVDQAMTKPASKNRSSGNSGSSSSSTNTSSNTSDEAATETSDDYETMPLDIRIMLAACHCDKRSDLIWESFPARNGFGFSTRYIEHLGFRVYKPPPGESVDFFDYSAPPRGVTCIISNVPFSKKRAILQRLVEFAVPFCVIMPSDVVQRDYLSDVVRQSTRNRIANGGDDDDRRRWSVLMPNKTLRYHRDGRVQPLARFKSSFYVYADEGKRGEKGKEEGERREEDEEVEKESGKEEEAGKWVSPLSPPSSLSPLSSLLPLMDADDALADVRVKVFDYAALLRKHASCDGASCDGACNAGNGMACKEIHTTGARLGKRKC
jgi:hypothetical protein